MFDLLAVFPLAVIPAFMLLALVHEARYFEKPPWWKTRMTLVTMFIVAASITVTTFWGMLFDGVHLLDGSVFGTFGGAVVGILTYEFVHYWYHRSVHRFDWLWRMGHQMHHSAEAMDAFSANYGHPVDLLLFASWSSLVFFPLLGLTVEAAIIAGAWLGFNAMFQHANIRTPRWLGYFVQRPESHVIHHARSQHRYNYANLPLWDMAFGTFRNPESVDGVAAGFYTGASTRIKDMLVFRDISEASGRPAAASNHDSAARHAA